MRTPYSRPCVAVACGRPRRRLPRSFALGALTLTGLVTAHPSPARALLAPHFWSKRLGSTGVGSDRGYAVAGDASGNVWVTGRFVGTVDFGGGPLTSAGDEDIFLAKYDAYGNYLGSQRFGSTGLDEARAVAVDPSGNVWITGGFLGSVSFGGSTLTAVAGSDMFLAEYDSNGVHLLSLSFGTSGFDKGYSLAIDASGNVWVAGGYGANPTEDIFAGKYSPTGTLLVSKTIVETGNNEEALGVAVDAAGNAFVTGYFWSSINFGGGALNSAGLRDLFLVKYNSAGVHQWSRSFGGTSTDLGNAIAVDPAGNVIITGETFSAPIDFGGGPLSVMGNSDLFLAKFDGNGTHLWSFLEGGVSTERGNSIFADGAGNLIVAGNGLSGYDPSGTRVYSYPIGLGALGCTLDAYGNVVVTGWLQGTFDFGGGPLTAQGIEDAYLVKYGPRYLPQISSIVDVGNDQGRCVRISFQRAGLDNIGNPQPVTNYEVYRRADTVNAATSAPGGQVGKQAPVASQPTKLSGWEVVGSVAPHGETDYVTIAPTLADSTAAGGMFYSAFFIRAATADPFRFYDSPPDSGYSLDNLAPGVPSGLTYSAGQLSWNPSDAADFDYFTVYGSSSPTFDGSAVVVNYTSTNGLNVAANPYPHYFLTATDMAGNEGQAAAVDVVTGVAETPRSYVLSLTSYPNPFNPATTIGFTVPAPGRVTIGIYDARGARITTLLDEQRLPGGYTVSWNGRDAAGAAVASGAYAVRIEHAGVVRQKKIVLVK